MSYYPEEDFTTAARPLGGISVGGGKLAAGHGSKIGPPELATVSDALSVAAEMAGRVEALADRICGCRPTNFSGESDSEQPDGVAPRMADQARSLSQAVSRAHDALSRIESVLP